MFSLKNDNSTTLKKNLLYSIVALLILSFFIYIIKNKIENNALSAKMTQIETDTTYRKVDSTDHFKLKNVPASIDIVNYFSLDCPYCRRAYILEDFLLQKEKYPNVNIVYRHNPLLSQPLSAEKAIITECVYQQSGDMGMFGFLDHVFSDFNIINKDNEWIKKIANFYITSKTDFEACLKSDELKDKIQKEKNENYISGIVYTPTILIFKNGIFIKKYEEISEAKFIEIIKTYGK